MKKILFAVFIGAIAGSVFLYIRRRQKRYSARLKYEKKHPRKPGKRKKVTEESRKRNSKANIS
jgi:hypothetical protein